MDGLTLLRQARQAGLDVTAAGDRLVVQGPRHLEAVARRLLAAKLTVLEALAQEEHEIAWRIEAMRPQSRGTGANPLLVARPNKRFPLGSCCSCGDALRAGDRYRCAPCVHAVVAILDAIR